MDVVADTTGNKYFKGGAKIMKATGNGIQNIENNEAQKLIDQILWLLVGDWEISAVNSLFVVCCCLI